MTNEDLAVAVQKLAAALGLPREVWDAPDLPEVKRALTAVITKRLFGARAGAIEGYELEAIWEALEAMAEASGGSVRQRLGFRGPRDVLTIIPGARQDMKYQVRDIAAFYDWQVRGGDPRPISPMLISKEGPQCPTCDQPISMNAWVCRLCGEWKFYEPGPVQHQKECAACKGDGLSRQSDLDYCRECNGHGYLVKFGLYDKRNGSLLAEVPRRIFDHGEEYARYMMGLQIALRFQPPGQPVHRGKVSLFKRMFGG